MYSTVLTTLLFLRLVPWKGPVLSVSPSKCLKCQQQQKYFSEYGLVIHPVKVATRKSGRNSTATPTMPTLYPTLPYLSIFSKGLYSLLNFLSSVTGWMTNPVWSTISYRLLSQFHATSFFWAAGMTCRLVIGPNKLYYDWSEVTDFWLVGIAG